jgi:integrase
MIARLNYHRCHGLFCEGGHPAKTFTSEPEEHKKNWKRCKCPIVASGSLNRVHRRMATKQTDWVTAAAKMAPYLTRNSWDDPEPPPQPPSPSGQPVEDQPKDSAPGVTVTAAVKAYLKAHGDADSANETIRGHGYSTAKILDLSRRLGVTRMDEWTCDMVRQIQAESTVNGETARTQLNRIKAFFNWSMGRGWIGTNPGKVPAVIKNRASKEVGHNQKFPFTDEDLERMFEACGSYGNVPSGTRIWVGQDLEDFIAISVYTGLRISDVATFHIDRLQGQREVHVRTTKANTMVYTSVPEWLAERIRIRARTVGPLIFGGHTSKRLCVITCEWRKRLNRLWDLCGPWAVKPTPHRFRHTFARVLLQKGIPPATVAELMGNTETVVRQYYSAWVPERQERISRLLDEAFADAPNPFTPRKNKVLPIRKLG